MSKSHLPGKPSRNFGWLFELFLGAGFAVLAIGMVVGGQFTLGKWNGRLVTMVDDPLTFWGSVAIPAAVSVFMFSRFVRGELRFRRQLREHEQELRNRSE